MSRTLDGRFLECVERYPDRIFMRRFDGAAIRTVSYADAARRTAATVHALAERGLRPGDRVVCYLDELVPSVWFCLAAAHAGVWPVPIGPSFSVDAVQQLVQQVGAAAIFTTVEHAPKLVARGLEPLTPLDPATTPSLDDARQLLHRAEAAHTGDDVYMLQPSSGTTGQSKLVMLPHRHQCYVVDLLRFDLRREDEPPHRLLLIAALTHGMGQIVFANAISLGAELVVPNRHDVHASLDEVRALDPDFMTMTPRVLRSFHAQIAGGDRLFGPSAKVLLIGGAVSDGELLQQVHDQGIDVIEAYGAAEFGFASAGPRGGWRRGSVGKIAPDVKLRIDDDGELLCWSPEHMVGYYGDEQATRAAFTADGYYRTGDYCEIDRDGYLRYTGRKKDVFNTYAGTNVFPAQMEAAIDQLAWVRQVVLVGDQRPYMTALVVLADPAAPTREADGFLDARAHAELYASAARDLARINREFEAIERVRRFALFATPMPDDMYTVVGHQKIRRSRPAIAQRYQPRIAALYAAATDDHGVVADT